MIEPETHESEETLEESRIRFGFDNAEVDQMMFECYHVLMPFGLVPNA